MTEPLPSATIAGGTVSIRFFDSTPSLSVQVTCTVDLTDFGDVIGIEVLGWRQQVSGGLLDAPAAHGQVRWSYDKEMDALYIHLMDGRGQVQRSAIGNVSLDSNGRVVRLQIPIPSGTPGGGRDASLAGGA